MMGQIARESTAPIADTETASADEVELELSKIFTELNGKLDDGNFVSGANVSGAKFLDGSIPGSKAVGMTLTLTEIAGTTLTTSNLTDALAPQYHESRPVTSVAMTSSSSFVDCEGVTSWTMTPHAVTNYLYMTFTNTSDRNVTGGVYAYGFSVNGTDTGVMGAQEQVNGVSNTVHVLWAEAAPLATEIIVKPRYKLLSGSATGCNWGTRQFSAMLVPIK